MTSPQLVEVRVEARNTAATSENRIHADNVARQYGFRGGLVPGVTTMAYVLEAVLQLFGEDFLSRGAGTLRLTAPVYEGEAVTARLRPAGDRWQAAVAGPDGTSRAEGSVWLRALSSTPRGTEIPAAPLPAERPLASPEVFAGRPVLGTRRWRFDLVEAERYLGQIGLGGSAFRSRHPGALLREANSALTANVRLGPWVHVESAFELYGAPEPGEEVETRSRVIEAYERKGHRFVRLEVLVRGREPLIWVDHLAIYELRAPTAPTGEG